MVRRSDDQTVRVGDEVPQADVEHIAEAGPALGVHLGLGGLIVGFIPQPGAIG